MRSRCAMATVLLSLCTASLSACHLIYPFDAQERRPADGAVPGPDLRPQDAPPPQLDAPPPQLDAPSPQLDAAPDQPNPRDLDLLDAGLKDKTSRPTDLPSLPDKMPPPDKGTVCSPPKTFSEAPGTLTGWFPMAGGGNYVKLFTTQLRWGVSASGSAGRNDAAGLACVPKGKSLSIQLTVQCTSGDFNVSVYETYCTASSCNMATHIDVCNFTCSASTTSKNITCTIAAAKVEGRWIRAVQVSRNAGASQAIVSWVALTSQ